MSEQDGERGSGLSGPNNDAGTTPPPWHAASEGDAPPTRRSVPLWDRVKVIFLLVFVWVILIATATSQNPILAIRDAADQRLRSHGWLLALVGLDVLRQIHYFVSERSAGYHQFWTVRIFGGIERRLSRYNDWNRYRIGRVAKLLVFLSLLGVFVGGITGEPPLLALLHLPATIWRILPFVLQLAFGFFFIMFQFIGLFWFLSRGGSEVYFPDDIKTRFSDVWGQDAVLEKVTENILFLEDPEAIEEKGGYVPGGLLLWGPPGTGKTLMAEAVAGETGRPFIFVDPGAFINMFMGIGILKVKSLFRKARKLALRYGGVVMFFDEADALGNRGQLAPGGWNPRATPALWDISPACNGATYLAPPTAALLMRDGLSSATEPPRRIVDRIMMGAGMGGGGMGTLQALLTEISGLKKPRGLVNRLRRAIGMRPKPPPKYRILIMMATNMPQSLDEALLRPGRIDRIYKVGYPSKEGRIRTYNGYLDKVRHALTAEEVERLATITPYATGASIKDLVNEALITAIREGRGTITWSDVVKAKHLKDLGPPEDVEYIERERHAVAIHEACHAVAAYRVRQHLTIDLATIQKGGTYLGMVASIPPEDQFTRWRSEYEADVMVSVASLVGERMFFEGDSSSGVSGDLESATRIATLMEGYWGMGSTIASHGVTREVGVGGGRRPKPGPEEEKDLLEGNLGDRIESLLAELLERTEALLAENRREIFSVAHALETHKTLHGEDVSAIIEGIQGPLVDGRAYRDPGFLEAAEEYHAQVVAAHRGHGRVQVALPLLPPAEEDEPAASTVAPV